MGDATAVARIVNLVEEAADHRAPIQNIADRFAAAFMGEIAEILLWIFLILFVVFLVLHFVRGRRRV